MTIEQIKAFMDLYYEDKESPIEFRTIYGEELDYNADNYVIGRIIIRIKSDGYILNDNDDITEVLLFRTIDPVTIDDINNVSVADAVKLFIITDFIEITTRIEDCQAIFIYDTSMPLPNTLKDKKLTSFNAYGGYHKLGFGAFDVIGINSN